MKKPTRVLIITLIIFIAFLGAVYVSNIKSYTYFKCPNRIVLYKNGHKKTYTRFSFKYTKILKALNDRFDETITTPMTSSVHKEELDTMKHKGNVLVLEYNKTQTSTFKANLEYTKIKYDNIYFPLDVYHETQAMYVQDRKTAKDYNPMHDSRLIKGLYIPDDLNKILK